MLLLINNQSVQPRHVESVRHVMTAAAPIGVADMEKLLDKYKGRMKCTQAYGLTEASPFVLNQSWVLDGGMKMGGCGLIIPNTSCKIVDVNDPENKALGPHESGELLVRGPQVSRG